MLIPLRGREARAAPLRTYAVRTAAQASGFWLVFLGLLPFLLLRVEEQIGLGPYRFGNAGWRAAGILLFLAASGLNVTSAWFLVVRGQGTPLPLECPRALVAAGPYRYVRNPMALAGLAQGAAVGLYLGSPLVLLYVAAGALFWHFVMRRWEEEDLERRFGEPYRRYRNAVRCWVPRLRGCRHSELE